MVSISHQLIEGMAFLHKHNVTHRHLKPANIVVALTSLPWLYIIDLDLAVWADGEKEMLLSWCGMEPWITPELGMQDNPAV